MEQWLSTLFSDARSPSGALGSLTRSPTPLDSIVLTPPVLVLPACACSIQLTLFVTGTKFGSSCSCDTLSELFLQLRFNRQFKYGLPELTQGI